MPYRFYEDMPSDMQELYLELLPQGDDPRARLQAGQICSKAPQHFDEVVEIRNRAANCDSDALKAIDREVKSIDAQIEKDRNKIAELQAGIDEATERREKLEQSPAITAKQSAKILHYHPPATPVRIVCADEIERIEKYCRD